MHFHLPHSSTQLHFPTLKLSKSLLIDFLLSKMKRKCAPHATSPSPSPLPPPTSTTNANLSSKSNANAKARNVRSNIPRRKRAHISPILLLPNLPPSSHKLFSTSPLNLTSLNSTCDDVSCNTTLSSALLPPQHDVIIKKPRQHDVINKQEAHQQQVSLSENSCVESCSVVAPAVVHSPTATVDQVPARYSGEDILSEFNLECKESLEEDDYYEVSSFTEITYNSSEYDDLEDFTDEYTPSIWLNSGSEFSEKSSDDSDESPTFSLFNEFKTQFVELLSDELDEVSSLLNDHYSDHLASWKFEDEEDEESYRLLRSRERNQTAKVKDYAEEYKFGTDYAGLITEQRVLMVNWIIELSREKDLHNETMFLAVRLLDRFLSKGFFTSRRNLQILGIACLTLAIRVEENQPYNSVRQKSFYVGSNTYCRTEIVAMEWVVLEVLKFQCISVTVFNFLWFYLKAAEADEKMERNAKYLAGLTLLDHRLLRFWPSSLAAALVILVSHTANQQESCHRVMQVHVRKEVDDLLECIKSLEKWVKYPW